ncbi:MAG: hypothetical protein NZ749_00730, partial [bacterium]|nr:hypothetical protein [bacterium]
TPDSLSKMLDILVRAQAQLRQVSQQRVLLDMAMVQITSIRRQGETGATRADAGQKPAGPVVETMSAAVESAARQEASASAAPVTVEEAKLPSTPSVPTASAAQAAPQPASALPPSPDAPELLKLVQARWEQIIARVAERSRGGAEVLRDARPVRVEGENTLVLQFRGEFAYTQMQSEKRRQFVEQTISRVLGGKQVALQCELSRTNILASSQQPHVMQQDDEELDGEQYAREVAQAFDGYIELEGG